MHILFFLYLPNITKYFIFAKSVFRLYILWLCIYLSQLSMHIDAFQLHKLFLCNLFVLPKTNNYLLFLCLCSFLCSYHSSVLKLLKNSASALTTFPLVLTASQPSAGPEPTCSRLGWIWLILSLWKLETILFLTDSLKCLFERPRCGSVCIHWAATHSCTSCALCALGSTVPVFLPWTQPVWLSMMTLWTLCGTLQSGNSFWETFGIIFLFNHCLCSISGTPICEIFGFLNWSHFLILSLFFIPCLLVLLSGRVLPLYPPNFY